MATALRTPAFDSINSRAPSTLVRPRQHGAGCTCGESHPEHETRAIGKFWNVKIRDTNILRYKRQEKCQVMWRVRVLIENCFGLRVETSVSGVMLCVRTYCTYSVLFALIHAVSLLRDSRIRPSPGP